MSGKDAGRLDPRAKRTRKALVEALNRLILDRRKRDIRVADVIEEAKVGRSTFYDHYSSPDELHMEALKGPLTPLAEAAAGQGDEKAVAFVLRHFWDYRDRARRTLDGKVERQLAGMIEDRLADEPLLLPKRLAARQLSAAALAPVLAWVTGEASSTAEALAAAICRSGRAQVEILRQPEK